MNTEVQRVVSLPTEGEFQAVVERDRVVSNHLRRMEHQHDRLHKAKADKERAERIRMIQEAECENLQRLMVEARLELRAVKKKCAQADDAMRRASVQIDKWQARLEARVNKIKSELVDETAKKVRREIGLAVVDDDPYRLPVRVSEALHRTEVKQNTPNGFPSVPNKKLA